MPQVYTRRAHGKQEPDPAACPKDGQLGKGDFPTLDDPHRGRGQLAQGDLVPPPQRAKLVCKSVRCGVGDGAPRLHLPRSMKTGSGRSPSCPKDGRLGEGECPTPDTPHQSTRRPPTAPSCPVHSTHSQLARACAVKLVTGPHPRTASAHRKPAAAPRTGGRERESARPQHLSRRHKEQTPCSPQGPPHQGQ